MFGTRFRVLSLLGAIAALFAAPIPVQASGGINCTATDGSGASINIGVGRLPVLAILNAVASDGTNTWSTNPVADETEFAAGQGFMDDRQVLIDFTDPNIERILVSLRLFQASGDKDYAEAGVLIFDGLAAFPVQCENG